MPIETGKVRFAREGPRAVLTLDNPPVNALRTDMLQEIAERVTGAAEDGALAAVITGAGNNAFCAGGDIDEMSGLDAKEGAAVQQRGQEAMWAIEHAELITIAAVHAFCAGGGLELALACDLRIASKSARFTHPEVNLGMIPGYGGTIRLPRAVGRDRAKEIILTARTVRSDEALRIGLVQQVLPDGEEVRAAKDLAMRIASKAPLAVKATKKAVNEGWEKPYADGFAIETGQFARVVESHDLMEGIKAFIEKRQPKWEGK
jgi:enoyl-CoA hydratase/carnithine racemase